jgi:hypothetical protein
MVLAVLGMCINTRRGLRELTVSQLEGLLTFVIGFISYFYLPISPTRTKGPLWRRSWYTEHEETIMVNRILRDDPAKGITALQEPATFQDILNAWSDKSMWGLYFIGLVAYIPASPVQGYLSLTLKRIGFSTFDSNMLSIPSAALQITLMLALAYSSNHFAERTFHCIIGEFWCLPLLVALLTLPAGGHEWGRFTITTMIAGCAYCCILELVLRSLIDYRRSLFPPNRLGLDQREQLRCQKTSHYCCHVQRDRASRLCHLVA